MRESNINSYPVGAVIGLIIAGILTMSGLWLSSGADLGVEQVGGRVAGLETELGESNDSELEIGNFSFSIDGVNADPESEGSLLTREDNYDVWRVRLGETAVFELVEELDRELQLELAFGATEAVEILVSINGVTQEYSLRASGESFDVDDVRTLSNFFNVETSDSYTVEVQLISGELVDIHQVTIGSVPENISLN